MKRSARLPNGSYTPERYSPSPFLNKLSRTILVRVGSLAAILIYPEELALNPT